MFFEVVVVERFLLMRKAGVEKIVKLLFTISGLGVVVVVARESEGLKPTVAQDAEEVGCGNVFLLQRSRCQVTRDDHMLDKRIFEEIDQGIETVVLKRFFSKTDQVEVAQPSL